ncbi:beta strand repeat-containing protein [Ilumatobacter coccineus]|uniref:beta strand repeat-containing protein n=1 Tax=Ilumatobacter coccineus TaxID=467094 RepID=UPI00138AFACA|nr:Ig-like domain-containing protein [Ilumatobacter coccineus]
MNVRSRWSNLVVTALVGAAVVVIPVASASAAPTGVEPSSSAVSEAAAQTAETIVVAERARFAETRTGLTTFDGESNGIGRLAAGDTIEIEVAGRGEIPADAAAALVYVTAVRPESTGYLTIFDCAEPRPLASSLNYVPSLPVGNEIVAALSDTGSLCVFSFASTDLTIDVGGFVPAASPLVSFAPRRIVDTRDGSTTYDGEAQGGGRTTPGEPVTVDIAGRIGIPEGVDSVLANIAAVRPDGPGNLVAHPCLATPPTASSLNYVTDTTRANELLLDVDGNGNVCVETTTSVDLVIDVVGYVPTGTNLRNQPPVRLVDTRDIGDTIDGTFEGEGRRLGDTEYRVRVAGRGGIPAGASAALLNLVVVQPDGFGYATVHPCEEQRPVVASMNYSPGVTGANEIFAEFDAAGDVCIYTSSGAHLVVDGSGYVAPINVGVDETDLSISASSAPDPVDAGEPLTYTVAVTNNSSVAATGVAGLVTLPSGVVFRTTTGCIEDPSGAPSCTIGELAAGATVTYEIDVDVDAAAAGTLVANFSVLSDQVDSEPSDNATAVSTAVDALVVDDPPVITAPVSSALSVSENSTLVVDVEASDPEGDVEGAGLSYSLSGPDQGLFAIDGSGVLSFVSAPDFEAPGDSGGDNGYSVTVTVTDSGALTDSRALSVNVTDVNEAPTVTAPVSSTVSVSENSSLVVDVEASDPEGDVEGAGLSYSLSGPDQGLFAIDGSGVLSFVSAPDFEAPGDSGGDNGYSVTVTVTDSGALTDSRALSVNVTDVNEAPIVTTTAGSTSFTEGDSPTVVDGGVSVSDPDGDLLDAATVTISAGFETSVDTLSASASGGIVAGDISYAPTTGVLTIDPATAQSAADFQAVLRTVTFANASSTPSTANRTITFSVDDGALASAGADKIVNVSGVNFDPVPTNATISYNAIGNTLLRVDGADADDHDTPVAGRVASTTDTTDALAKAAPTDADSAVVTYVAGTFTTVEGGTIVLDDDGDFTYLPAAGFEGADSYAATLTDGDGGTANVTIELTVADMVWYVEDTVHATKNPAGGDGRSTDAFETLAGAEAASGPGDYILVFETDAPLDGSIELQDGQKLFGQAVEEESPSRLPAGLMLEEIADTNARPFIDNSAGDAITIAASAGAVEGVEIRHLRIEGQGDAIDVRPTGTASVRVAFSDLELSGATGAGLSVSGAATSGIVTVSEVESVDVASAGAGGLLFDTVTFDADDVTIGVQTVEAGDSSIGDPATPADIVGDGLRLNDVSGSIDFGTLDIGNTDGTGLYVRDAGGKAGAFQLDTDAGTINTVNGAAVDIDPVALGLGAGDGMVLTSVTALNSGPGTTAHGINLDTVSGAFTVTGDTSLTRTGGELTNGIVIVDSSAEISFDGEVDVVADTGAAISIDTQTTDVGFGPTQVEAQTGVSIVGSPSITTTFDSLDVVAANGTGIVTDDAGTLEILGTASTVAVTAGTAIDVTDTELSGAGSSPANFATVTSTAGTGSAIALTRMSGALAIAAGSVTSGSAPTVDLEAVSGDVSYGGDVTGGTGRAIEIINSHAPGVATFDFSGDITTVSGAGIYLYTNEGSGSTSIASFTGTLTLSTGGSDAFVAAAAGSVVVTDPANANSITTTGGTAISMVNTDIGAAGMKFTTVSATNAVSGIRLTNAGTGPFVVTGGAIVNASYRGLDISGGNGNVTMGASINTTSTGRSVEATTHTGGTITLAGAIDDNGIGIRLASNIGATITFTGGVDVDTSLAAGTLPGLTASSGGTLTILGPNNSIDTTASTGTALEVVSGTTIGAAGLTFRSVSASGGVHGIELADTGTSGGVTITGDGSNLANGSGGTISATTGSAIELSETADFSATSMDVSADNAAPGVQRGVNASQLTGTNIIRASTFGGFAEENAFAVRVVNSSGTLDRFTVDASSFTGTSTGSRGGAVSFELTGSAGGRIEIVNGTTFDGIKDEALGLSMNGTGSTELYVADSVFSDDSGIAQLAGGRASGVSLLTGDSAALDVEFRSNIFREIGAQTGFGGTTSTAMTLRANGSSAMNTEFSSNTIQNVDVDGLLAVIGAESSTGRHLFADNTVTSVARHALWYSFSGTSGPNDVTIRDNVMTSMATASSFDAVTVITGSDVDVVDVSLTNNTIEVPSQASIPARLDFSNATANATLHGNTMRALHAVSSEAYRVSASGPSTALCLDMNGANAGADRNTAQANGGLDGFLATANSSSIALVGLSTPTEAAAEAHLLNTNDHANATVIASGTFTAGPTTCPTPTLP